MILTLGIPTKLKALPFMVDNSIQTDFQSTGYCCSLHYDNLLYTSATKLSVSSRFKCCLHPIDASRSRQVFSGIYVRALWQAIPSHPPFVVQSFCALFGMWIMFWKMMFNMEDNEQSFCLLNLWWFADSCCLGQI